MSRRVQIVGRITVLNGYHGRHLVAGEYESPYLIPVVHVLERLIVLG